MNAKKSQGRRETSARGWQVNDNPRSERHEAQEDAHGHGHDAAAARGGAGGVAGNDLPVGERDVRDSAAGHPEAGDGAPSLQTAAPFVEVEIPIRIESTLNLREHWTARHRRAVTHDEAVTYSLIGSRRLADVIAVGPPYIITITRIAPRRLDDDNAIGGAKHVRDSLARLLGIDDGDTRITWKYGQERGRYATRVRIECRRS